MFLVQQGSHSTSCYYRDKECFKCHNKGQAKHACRTQVKGKETKSVHMMDGDSDVNQTYIKTLEMDISSTNRADDIIKITPQVNDVSLEMELDTVFRGQQCL